MNIPSLIMANRYSYGYKMMQSGRKSFPGRKLRQIRRMQCCQQETQSTSKLQNLKCPLVKDGEGENSLMESGRRDWPDQVRKISCHLKVTKSCHLVGVTRLLLDPNDTPNKYHQSNCNFGKRQKSII